MKLKDYSMELKVGAFVGITALIFIAAIMSLGGGGGFFRKHYDLKLKLATSEGVGPGSVVQFMGVPVGNVKQIDIIPSENMLLLTLKINKDFQHLITEGATAGLKTQGALGDKFVLIQPGSKSSTVALQDGSDLIARADGDLMSTLTGENGFGKFFEVLAGLEALLSNLNANGKSAELMHNLAESSHELKLILKDVNVLVGEVKDQKKVEKTLNHLASVMQKLDNGDGTLGQLINDPSLHESLRSMLGGSKRSQYMKGLIRQTIETGKD
jgi:phospholipid/cholesterol/gamma-HCH transport system substrate-binding protein